MRIAYVCTDPGVPVFGRKGASVHVQASLRAMVARGDEVHLLTVAPGGDPTRDLVPVHVHHLPIASVPPSREVRRQEADARSAEALARLHAAGALDLVYERYSLWGRTAMTWAAANAVPSLLEVNAPLVEEQAAHRVLVDRAGAEQVARQALSAAGAVVCVSDAVAAWARRYAADASRVHMLPNGVDTGRVRPSTAAPTPPSGTPFTIGFVGTLKPWHGVQTLVDALAVLLTEDPTYRLLVVGDGPLAAPLRFRLDEAGISGRVEMTGAVDHHTVPALLRRMDVAAAPYPPMDDFYFSPLKLYEYLAAGVPVVASRVGDLHAILEDGRLGVLVEPGNVTALAEAIATLRADPDRRTRLARAGRRRAVELHDWSRVVSCALSLARVHPDAPRTGSEEVLRVAAR